MLIDTHAHLDFPQFDADRQEVITRSQEAGVGIIVNAGAGLEASRAGVALAETYPQVYAAVGVHPHEAKTLNEDVLKELRALAQHPRVVAIGEIGLDYYRDLSPRPVQRQAFQQQLALARELGKPIIVHDREAHQDVMSALRRWVRDGYQPSATSHQLSAIGHQPVGVMHCFSGDLAMAREVIEMGFYISIPGPVTFANARRLPELVRTLPLERLLIETDCPYLTPHPHRGKRNEPAYVRLVAEAIAQIKGIPLEQVARLTTANARALFGLESPGAA
ncbi:MAG: TatD family hydrolase [Anaerolineae bacterium]|nr:TatD family hydrolase [Anaerolineae bacterium]